MERPAHITCPNCKYDLHGLITSNVVTCPECGSTWSVASLTQPQQRWRFKWRFAAIAIAPPFTLPVVGAIFGLENAENFVMPWWVACVICLLAGTWLLALGGRPIRQANVASLIIRFIAFAILAFCLDFILVCVIAFAMDGGRIKM